MGKDRDGGLVLVDIWKRGGDRTNSNWIILAKPGAGKSFTAKMLLLREYMQGSRVIIIDPEREYKDMCKKLNGVWINCTGGEGRINPLQVRLRPVEEKETDESNSLKSPLALHIQTLRTFLVYILEI